jgi:hypothetical protein
MFLDFSLQGFFMEIIMILYVVVFFCFSHKVSRIFAQVFIIYIFRFFSLDFLKIIFILYNIQVVLQRECYNINVK